MSKIFKRVISLLLVILCVITMFPAIDIAAASTYTPDWKGSGIYAYPYSLKSGTQSEVFTFKNTYSVPIQIKKTFEDGGNKSDVYYFTLTNAQNTARYLLKTKSNGYLTVETEASNIGSYEISDNNLYLDQGNYTLSELGMLNSGASVGSFSASDYYMPAKYNKISDIDVSITATGYTNAQDAGNSTIYIEAVNTVSYPIVVIKSDKADSTIRLSGAVFGIYSDPDCQNLIDTVTTNANGEGLSERLRIGSYYYVREITPPTGYSYDSTIHKIYVHYTQSRITLSDGTEAIPLYAENPLTPGFAAIAAKLKEFYQNMNLLLYHISERK